MVQIMQTLILIILFALSKTQKLFFLFLTLFVKDNQKLSNFLGKMFERLMYLNKYKTKSENKDMPNEYINFLNSTFVEVNRLFALIFLKRNNDVKRYKVRRYYLSNGAIKNYNVNGHFYNQTIDSHIKQFQELVKVKNVPQDVCWIMIASKIAITL